MRNKVINHQSDLEPIFQELEKSYYCQGGGLSNSQRIGYFIRLKGMSVGKIFEALCKIFADPSLKSDKRPSALPTPGDIAEVVQPSKKKDTVYYRADDVDKIDSAYHNLFMYLSLLNCFMHCKSITAREHAEKVVGLTALQSSLSPEYISGVLTSFCNDRQSRIKSEDDKAKFFFLKRVKDEFENMVSSVNVPKSNLKKGEVA